MNKQNLHTRFLIAFGSLLVYVLVFLIFYSQIGRAIAALCILPGAVFGWLLGVRGGALFGIFAIVTNMLLFRLVGNIEAGGLIPTLVGSIAYGLVSAGIGWVRELNQQVRQQAKELRAERALLQEEIERRVQAETRLTHEALHDPLTNLPNRRLFLMRLEQALAQSKCNHDAFCAVLYLDLDRFKSINDSLGHDVGDQLLIAVASRLRSTVRSSDTVARLGGDEFAILLESTSSPPNVHTIFDRILENVTAPYVVSGTSLGGGGSIGVVMNVTAYDRIDDILRDADTAMYHAKSSGGNRIQLFDGGTYIQSAPRLSSASSQIQADQQ